MKNYEKRQLSNPHLIFQEWNANKTSKTVLEVIPPNDDEGFDKVTLSIQKTENGESTSTTFYFTVEEMLTLAHSIMRCDIQQMIYDEKCRVINTNANYPDRIKMERGGKVYDNGYVLARCFYFQPAVKSKTNDVMICIENGDGYQTEEGLINMNYKGNVKKHSVAMTYSKFLQFGVSCYTRLNALMIAREIRGFYKPIYNQNQSATEHPVDMPEENYDGYIGDMR